VAEGGIVELGTHDQLVSAGGRYADLFATWSAAATPDAAPTTAPSTT